MEEEVKLIFKNRLYINIVHIANKERKSSCKLSQFIQKKILNNFTKKTKLVTRRKIFGLFDFSKLYSFYSVAIHACKKATT